MTRSESIRRRIWASRMNRSRTSALPAQLSASSLTATSLSSTGSRARYTVANPPDPIRERISYRPIVSTPCEA